LLPGERSRGRAVQNGREGGAAPEAPITAPSDLLWGVLSSNPFECAVERARLMERCPPTRPEGRCGMGAEWVQNEEGVEATQRRRGRVGWW
jgi:hypothetical protein